MPQPKTWSVLDLLETGLPKSSHMSRWDEHALILDLLPEMAIGYFCLRVSINNSLYQFCSPLSSHLAGHATLATPGKSLSGMMLCDVTLYK